MASTLGIAVLVLSAVSFAQVAEACSCSILAEAGAPRLANGDVAPTADELSRQTFLFVGVAISQSEMPSGKSALGNGSPARYVAEFRVEELWRGPTHAKTLRVYTSGFGGSCGFHFKPGIRYLVFASTREDGLPFTDTCTRTTEHSKASDLLLAVSELLGPPTRPNPKAEVQLPMPPNNALQRTRFARR